ncbi:hypothetical protein V7L80_003024 [Vibrio harveyi]
MATHLSEFVSVLQERWREVDLLTYQLVEFDNKDMDECHYSALSRSASVLIVAHLEGFIKDLVKAVIHDINANCDFSSLSIAVQKTFCRKFLGSEDNIANYHFYSNQLITQFKETGCLISPEPFLFIDNKNPKPDVIKSVFSNFGISNVFAHLKDSDFDEVFEDMANTKLSERCNLALSKLKEDIDTFPYKSEPRTFNLKKAKLGQNERTLWQTFLDDINQKRHDVAHGNSFTSAESASTLHRRKETVRYLQLALIYLISAAPILNRPS